MAYNAITTLLGALRARHGEAVVDRGISGYSVAEFGRDAVGVIDDLVEPGTWRHWQTMTLSAPALLLRQNAAQIDLEPRGPKKPVPLRARFKDKPHVSTHRLLNHAVASDS
jgi:hypothetical protein